MSDDKNLRKRKIKQASENKSPGVLKKKANKKSSFKPVLAAVAVLFLCVFCTHYFEVVNYSKLLGLSDEQKIKKDLEPTVEVNNKKEAKDSKKGTKKAVKKPKNEDLEKIRLENERKLSSEADDKILDQLHKGEVMIEKKKSDSYNLFSKLSRSNPDSGRAKYGLARAMILKAEKERSNKILLESIEILKEVATMNYVTKSLKKKAFLLANEKYTFLGKYKDSLRMFGRMMREFNDDCDVMNQYGVIMLTVGKNDKAKPVYERILSKEPNNAFAQVHLAFILKAEGNWERSADLFKKGLMSNEPGTQEGKFYFHLGDALYRIGNREEAGEWYQRGADKGLFRSKYQRSLYNIDRLQSQPFWTPQQARVTDIVKKLESKWEMIRDEALQVMDVNSHVFLHEEESLKNTGEWRQFTLFQRGKQNKDCQRTPKTCSLVSKMTQAAGCKRGQIKYSIMMPGTHVWPHTGPTNCRLRMHLGLVIPKTGNGTKLRCGDEIRTWEEGKVMIFDDSFEHEVWQQAESFRLIFIIDIWHPDITQREIKSLSPI